jgi:hypothetical protein
MGCVPKSAQPYIRRTFSEVYCHVRKCTLQSLEQCPEGSVNVVKGGLSNIVEQFSSAVVCAVHPIAWPTLSSCTWRFTQLFTEPWSS